MIRYDIYIYQFMPIDIRIHYQGKMAKYTCNPALSHDIPCLCCFPLTKPMSLSQKCRAYPNNNGHFV